MSTDSQLGPSIGDIFKRSNQVSAPSTEATGARARPSELVMIRHDDGQDYIVYEEAGFGLYINTKPERTQIDAALAADQIADGKFTVTRPFSFNEAAGVIAQNVALNDLADAWENGHYSNANFKATMRDIMGGDQPDIKAAFAKTQPAQTIETPTQTFDASVSEPS